MLYARVPILQMCLDNWRLDFLAIVNRLPFSLTLPINEEHLFVDWPHFEVLSLSRSILGVRILWLL